MTPDPSTATPRPPLPRRRHLPALDGLRGAAIIGVLLFHTGNLDGGFLGVDLFFALSGYLITGLLLREAEATGRVSLISFWGRRLRRLLPALATVLACTTLAVWAAGPPRLLRTALADGPWVQLNLVNWHLLAESAGYWDRFGSERVFEHLWSIAVEEQFYLVWPLLMALAALGGRRAGDRVALLAALVSLASLVWMAVLVDPADPTRVYTGTDTRAFSLLLGALAATPRVHGLLGRAAERAPRA
uniref:acyltransferase family protein n=1 Tax=Nocardiopsis potens TaxID=1246458 RepID=UPI00036D0D45